MSKIGNSVTNQATYTWTLTLYEQNGNLFVAWTGDETFRLMNDRVEVYKDGFPDQPGEAAWSSWMDPHHVSPLDTGLRSGSDWYGAIVAQGEFGTGPFRYVVKVGPTTG